MSLSWFFEAYTPNGGFNARSARRFLEGTEMKQPETLARETLQNSCDAELSPARPVRVTFRGRESSGDERRQLLDVLNVGRDSEPVRRRLIETQDPLKLLYIEDFNTVGLTGTDRADVVPAPDDHFVRLCRNIGDTHEEMQRGGSFGFGKSVYWSNSALYVVAFYSRFSPSPRTTEARSRFIAVGWFRDHEHADRRYTGRAWFGDAAREGAVEITRPLVDDEADRVAARIGFAPRPDGSRRGTSVLILGARDVDPGYLEEIRRAVETHYWPRILDGRLEAEFSWDGQPAGGVNLEARADLRDYLEAYRVAQRANGGTPPNAHVEQLEHQTRGRRGRRYHLGTVSTVVSDPAPDPERQEPLSKGIALMRAPRMVVQYYEVSSLPSVAYGSVFIASDELEGMLRKSEPPAHDRWSYTSTELDDEGRKVVQALLSKIRSSVSDYLEQFIEERPTEAKTCPGLGKMLSKYFSLRGGRTGPGPGPRPVSIQFESQPHRIGTGGPQRVAASLVVRTDRDHLRLFERSRGKKPTRLAVNVQLKPVVERGRQLSRDIGIDVFQDTDGMGNRRGSLLVFPVNGPAEHRINVVSRTLPAPDITTDLIVEAELETEDPRDG